MDGITQSIAIWVNASYMPYRVKPSFVIFDIRALWRSGLSVRVPGCQKLLRPVISDQNDDVRRWKNFDDIFSRYYTIQECDKHTHGQTYSIDLVHSNALQVKITKKQNDKLNAKTLFCRHSLLNYRYINITALRQNDQAVRRLSFKRASHCSSKSAPEIITCRYATCKSRFVSSQTMLSHTSVGACSRLLTNYSVENSQYRSRRPTAGLMSDREQSCDTEQELANWWSAGQRSYCECSNGGSTLLCLPDDD